MGKNTSITLGDHFENFINGEIKSGRYGSVSEVIRTALRLLESEERKLNDLRNALIDGEQSGFVEDFDSKEFLKTLHKKHE
ncbi:MAG: type II toxin-antitoxin system ParD family antitoxin [Flavobacteriia bacterium]|jgi:antitoxin ParD1/3/4|nr:type II toxin-antitoxin system ParD family antitoxin [Flavobacteriia bacterium]NBY39687.1 type II toxin-antitoxin system ParD family antitoxin [Flavobacteriia bacterium]